MSNNSGTIKKLVIDGTPYDVFGDAKASFVPSAYEVEGQATTGNTMFKMTKRVQVISGIDIAATPAQKESLASVSESLTDVTLAITLADGSVYRGSGRIKFDKWETETNKATIDLIPKSDWTPFLKK